MSPWFFGQKRLQRELAAGVPLLLRFPELEGVVYVLHCFTKKTNKTSPTDIEIARARLSALKQKLAMRKKRKPSR
jgi:phage-related protein